MPGLTGSVSAAAPCRLERLEAALYPACGLRQQRLFRSPTATAPGFACAVASRLPGSGIAERVDAGLLAFEGWLAEPDLPEAELPALLLDRFLGSGSAGPAGLAGAVEGLSGSFQIVFQEGGTTVLLADPVGSRRLFYVHDGAELHFAPEVAPLAGLAGAGRVDPANLVQFLVSGRFFAGETLLSGVRQLLPGEILLHRGRDIERRSSFRYTVSPPADSKRDPDPESDLPALAAELAAVVDRAVLRAFGRARDPVFLLSGGYDSRYIFHSVARAVADPSRLRTALFGQRMDAPGSDNVRARAVAGRFGVEHLTLPWRADLLPEQFAAMFAAQSGMTELVFTHSDELSIFRRLASEHGFGSVLRGDECFGPKGEEVASAEEGLRRVSMSHPRRVADLDRCLTGASEPWLKAHAERLERLLAGFRGGPSELRDTLYGRERLPALQNHHNYHKSHFLEMVNPLLDVDVLRFWSALPAFWRCDKRLFRECYHRRFGDPLDPPIATVDNGIDWPATLSVEPALAGWVRERLAALPEPLNRRYFLGCLDRILSGERAPAPAPGTFTIPAMKLVARAVVLGEWWRSGLVGG
jgi:asparagine synthetase B (glutamine-hydrolysing)